MAKLINPIDDFPVDDPVVPPQAPFVITDKTGLGIKFPKIIYNTPNTLATAFTPSPVSQVLQVVITVGVLPRPVDAAIDILVTILPPIPTFAAATISSESTLAIVPIPLPIESAIFAALRTILAGRVDAFFDTSRKLHTLLNFGDDYQTTITDWQYDPADSSNHTILVKLYQPLPDEIEPQTPTWIVREITPPVIDRLYTKFSPPPPPKIYLRPPNRNIQLTGTTGAMVENKTLATLFSSGSLDLVRPSDPALEGWFTDDIGSAELNVDYADYRQFVSFGSAKSRLVAFANKLLTLEDYERVIALNSASLVGTGASVTGSANYPAIQAIAEKRINVLRSFDAYERFLYYSSDVPYSSSLNTDDEQDELFFNADATWPKISGSVVPVVSASTWFVSQSAIADAYDRHNQNYLGNTIPQYIMRDDNSQEFVTFLNLVGHQFDIAKIYIDQMTGMYDRGSDPALGVSPDLVWNVAQGFGIDLPNQYAVKNLVDYTVGQDGGQKIYRQAAAETWKRFLHNQIFMMKSKGTKNSLRALANSYGILPTLLQIREGATPGVAYPTQSFETYEEQTNVLTFTSGSRIEIPWAASSSVSSSTVELRFATTNNAQPTTLYHGDNRWAVKLVPTSGTYGTVSVVSASVVTVSSSLLPIFSGDYYSTMVRYNAAGMELQVKRANGDVIVESSVTNEATPKVANLWFAPQKINLGGSGSFFGAPFAGFIDEFRMWGEVVTTTTFDLHVKYAGLYNGNTTTSARDSLYVRLSFNKPKNLGAAAIVYLNNEAPSYRSQTIKTANFPNVSTAPYNMDIIIREVVRYSPNAGGSQFTNNKILIVDPPTLRYQNGVPILDPKNSIVSLTTKSDNGAPNNTVGFYFSLTDAINDNIIRTFGNIDLQDLIGDPLDTYSASYPALDALSNLYWTTYAYNFNTNSFIDFVRNLLEPLFKQAKQLVPARAKLLAGIVHEPHILERAKIATIKPISVSGGHLTRRNTTDTYNLETDALTSQPTALEASWEQRDAVVVIADNYQPVADLSDLEGLFTHADLFTTLAEYDNYETAVATQDVMALNADNSTLDATAPVLDFDTFFDAEYVTFDDTSNLVSFKLNTLLALGASSLSGLSAAQLDQYKQALRAFRSPMSININDDYLVPAKRRIGEPFEGLIDTILPFTDFDQIEAYNYFSDLNGLIGIPTRQLTRVNNGILNNRGSWSSGTNYKRNDFVRLATIEWVCISTDVDFRSFIEPASDPANWQKMRYIASTVPTLRKAVVINDAVSIAPYGSLFSPALGYRPQHYKFTRDMRQGIIRHQWLGCVQTSLTTTDGLPPVETFFAPGTGLVVANPGNPVQPTNNPTGPILDVR